VNLVDALRKAGMPVLLAIVNVVLLGLWLGVLAPLIEDSEFTKRATQNANAGLRGQVEKVGHWLATIDESRDRYAGLIDRGFLDPQNRLAVARQLDQLRGIHGLTSIHYQITPERVLDDRATRKTGFTIVSTRITVKMLGLFDADLVSFSQAVIDELPGQVRPLSLALQRLTVPTEQSLKALREGTLIDFVGGEFVFEWNTLRPLVKKAEN
jgi:hypothetical protein